MNTYFIIDEECIASKYGVKTYVNNLINELTSCNYFIYHIILFSLEKKVSYSHQKNVIRIHIPNYLCKSKSIKNHELYFKYSYYIISKYIPKTGNIIFHFNYLLCDPIIEKLRSKRSKIHFLVTIHCENSKDDSDIIFEMKKKSLNKFDEIIVLSEKTYIKYIVQYKIDKNKIKFTRNRLNDFLLQKKLNDEKEIAKKTFPVNAKIILFVGRLVINKGLVHLINSFKIIAQKNPNAILIIAGDGDFSYFYKLTIGFWNQIYFVGNLAQDDLYKLYLSSDIGVLPSYEEQCNYVVIEMLMFGLPLILTRIDAFKDMIQDNKNGFSISYSAEKNPPIDENDLANKIDYLLNCNRDSYSLCSRNIFINKFNINNHSKIF